MVRRRILDPRKKVFTATDFSILSVGGYLMQMVDPAQKDFTQGFYIISLMSRLLTDVQSRYSVTEKELLPLVMMLDAHRNELVGLAIESWMDYKAWFYLFQSMEGLSKGPARAIRWRILLMSFRITVVFMSGKDLIGPDIASRWPFAHLATGSVVYPIGQPGAPSAQVMTECLGARVPKTFVALCCSQVVVDETTLLAAARYLSMVHRHWNDKQSNALWWACTRMRIWKKIQQCRRCSH